MNVLCDFRNRFSMRYARYCGSRLVAFTRSCGEHSVRVTMVPGKDIHLIYPRQLSALYKTTSNRTNYFSRTDRAPVRRDFIYHRRRRRRHP